MLSFRNSSFLPENVLVHSNARCYTRNAERRDKVALFYSVPKKKKNFAGLILAKDMKPITFGEQKCTQQSELKICERHSWPHLCGERKHVANLPANSLMLLCATFCFLFQLATTCCIICKSLRSKVLGGGIVVIKSRSLFCRSLFPS